MIASPLRLPGRLPRLSLPFAARPAATGSAGPAAETGSAPRDLGLPGRRSPEMHILLWMCVLIAVNQVGFGSTVAVVALYAGTFGVSQAAIGLTITIYGLARFLLNVPGGQIAERWGRRWSLALGGIVSVAGNILCGLAPTYPLFVAGRFVAGAGAALVLVGGQIILADIATPQNRGRLMGAYQGVFSFAVGIGPVVGGLLATHLGLNAPFFTYSILAAGVSLIAWFAVPETRNWRASTPAAPASAAAPSTTPPAAGAPAPSRPGRLAGGLSLLRTQRAFVLVSLLSFSTFFARTGALFGVVPLLGSSRLALTPDQIGIVLGMAQVFGLALAYPSGWLVDRFGRKIVIVPSTLLSAVALGLFAVAPDFAWFIGASLFWALSTGLSSSAPAAYVVDLAPPTRVAPLLSTYRMLSDFGYVVGPVLLGFVGDIYGGEAALVGTGLLLVVTSLLFGLYAPETHGPRARTPRGA